LGVGFVACGERATVKSAMWIARGSRPRIRWVLERHGGAGYFQPTVEVNMDLKLNYKM